MSVQENMRVVRAHYALFNKRDFDQAAILNTPDATWVNVATGETFRGPEGYRQFVQGWATAFPDAVVEVIHLVADEDGAAAEFIGRGTHNGPLKGPAGEIPPTGRAIEMPFCEVFRMREGKVAGVRLYFDAATMMRQLGLMS